VLTWLPLVSEEKLSLTTRYAQRLAHLSHTEGLTHLRQLLHGIEKEGLRVTPNGHIAQTPHPAALGSALTHPSITTDYSESLLEFITPTFYRIDDVLTHLTDIHAFVTQSLVNEIIWTSSMPCELQGDLSIPIANYGSSNIGQLKHVYRRGLWHRYGRTMQAIAGIHYNFSLPMDFWPFLQAFENDHSAAQDFRSASYFSLIRNFRRHAWLLYYLFGSTPAVDQSFLAGKKHSLEKLDAHTLYGPYATSLRMSDIGYNNSNQSSLRVCHNSINNYINMLEKATHTPHPDYEKIGIKKDGEYCQINTYILQIANEYYSSIRPKSVATSGKTPIHSLKAQGVEYIEVRGVDINPLLTVGISKEQALFIDVFLIFCLLQDSDMMSDNEYDRIANNHRLIVLQGRCPTLTLNDGQRERSVPDWGTEILDQLLSVASLLDTAHGGTQYQHAVEHQREKLSDPDTTPSAQMIAYLREQRLSFVEMALQESLKTAAQLKQRVLSAEVKASFEEMARRSLAEQAAIEKSDTIDFEQFRQLYIAQ
jgi:glutamate--cysteine ligase